MFIFIYMDLMIEFFPFTTFSTKLTLMLLSVALLTSVERKILAIVQGRESVRWVGVLGVLQPFIDAIKLVSKELVVNLQFSLFFAYSPAFAFCCSAGFWVFLPFGESICDFSYSLFGFYAISVVMSFIMFFAGFSSSNLFAYIGSIRYLSMVFSFELLFCLVFLILYSCSFTLNLNSFVIFQSFYSNISLLCSIFFIFCLIVLAELNRHPTDLGESEGDLVAGFFTEYSAMGFGFFFMGEYLNMFAMSTFICCLFLGLSPFSYVLPICSIFGTFAMIIIRGAYPRYRFDGFILLCWSSFIYVLIGFLFFLYGINFLCFNIFFNII